MYEYPNAKAMTKSEMIEAYYWLDASKESKAEAGRVGPYKSDSLNAKLVKAKEWLGNRTQPSRPVNDEPISPDMAAHHYLWNVPPQFQKRP